MKMVEYVLDGQSLTQEQLEEIREAKKRPIVFDEDCPRLNYDHLVFRRRPQCDSQGVERVTV